VNSDDPRQGEGWDFLDEESDAWYEALETTETEDGEIHVDVDAYDEFGNIQELVNFIAGTGSYSDTRRFTPGEEDREMKKRELMNDRWEVPGKIQQINEYLRDEEDLTPNEINLDPSAEVELKVTETEAKLRDAETKYTAHFIAYDPDEDLDEPGEPDAQFYLQGTWYDTPPEEMSLADVFNSVFTRP